jgi:AraC-like DNA-binding protein
MKALLGDLTAALDRLTKQEDAGVHPSPVPHLFLNRIPNTLVPKRTLTESLICLTVQGSETIHVEASPLLCSPGHFLLVAQNFPIVRQFKGTREGGPYLGLTLLLDIPEITRLIQEISPHSAKRRAPLGVAGGRADRHLINAFERLVGLIETPADIPILAPNISREIHYRLLTGEQGSYLRGLAIANKRIQRVRSGMEWLRKNADREISMDMLARHMGMSLSTMHAWFRSVTSMTPLQFQKQMKLQKARMLLLSESTDVSSVARRVGYKSASQFSSDYRQMFRLTPSQDMRRSDVDKDGQDTLDEKLIKV